MDCRAGRPCSDIFVVKRLLNEGTRELAVYGSRRLRPRQASDLVQRRLRRRRDAAGAEGIEVKEEAAYANLAQAMGSPSQQTFDLAEEPDAAVEPLAISALRAQALDRRPEIKAARLDVQAARQFASAGHALRYPTVTAAMSAGLIPGHVSQLSAT